MHRRALLELLDRYRPWDDADRATALKLRDFVARQPRCFERLLDEENPEGHITGSCWLLDPSLSRALMTHHKKLGKWLQLGGHSDGDPDTLNVAMREAVEESGIQNIECLSPEIFDLDIHRIPARAAKPGRPAHEAEPEHEHFDVRFLLRASESDRFQVSDESHALAWFTARDLMEMNPERSITRMVEKWNAFLTSMR